MGNKSVRVLSFLLFVASMAFGQQWDFGTWHRVKVGGLVTKKLSLSVEQQVRLDNNSTRLDETFTEFGLSQDLPKGFEIGAAYRLAWSPEVSGVYTNSHRYNVDLSYSRKVWKFKTGLRARFQHRPDASLFNDRLKPNDSPIFVRIKWSIAYRKLKDWKPGVEFEAFVRTDRPEENGAHKFRYRVFVDYDLPKRQELGLFYMLQTDHSGRQPEYTSVVGVNYSYEWKRPKKKKDKN
jgi:hypothetical protein